MTVIPEELAAFADKELEPARRAEIAAAVASDPLLFEQVRMHRALRTRLGEHFFPILDAPLPERLAAPLRAGEPSLPEATSPHEKRERERRLPRWSWFAGAVIAASLAMMLVLARG